MVADAPGKLIESNLVLNLSDPCALADASWIKPGKVSFLWWNGYVVGDDGKGQGGVDTATVKHYIRPPTAGRSASTFSRGCRLLGTRRGSSTGRSAST